MPDRWITIEDLMDKGYIAKTISENDEVIAKPIQNNIDEVEVTPEETKMFISDARGYKIQLPIAVVREEKISKTLGNSNEEAETEYIRLYIEEQRERFLFDIYIPMDEEERTNSWDTNVHLRIGAEARIAQHYSKDYVEMWFPGRQDRGMEGLCFDVPPSMYKYIKKAFSSIGVIIKESEQEEEKMEELKPINYTFEANPTEEELEKMISLVDLSTFAKMIKARLASQGTTNRIAEVNEEWAKNYLRTWATSKYKFYKMFGDNLSVQKKVDVEKTDFEFQQIKKELIGKFPLYKPILERISYKALRENTIKTKTASYINEVFFEDVNVKNHLSLTKFISLFGNKELDTEVSKIYQDKGTAHIYISINPIDFLTVSVNKSGWESCHNFYKGCYANAGLAYMNDATSLVAFRSENDMEIKVADKKIKWNTKNWRQMIYMSETNSSIVFSRQYPYDSDEVTKNVREMFEKYVSDFFGGSNKWILYHHQDRANVKVERGCGDLLYNDVAHQYGHKVIRAKDDTEKERTRIPIGKDVYGIISGNNILYGDVSIW